MSLLQALEDTTYNIWLGDDRDFDLTERGTFLNTKAIPIARDTPRKLYRPLQSLSLEAQLPTSRLSESSGLRNTRSLLKIS